MQEFLSEFFDYNWIQKLWKYTREYPRTRIGTSIISVSSALIVDKRNPRTYSAMLWCIKEKWEQKHCPSCHCPPERQRFFSPGKPRTLENVEAMIDQCERVFTELISYQEIAQFFDAEIYWHDYQIDAHPRCKRPLQTHRQRRFEHDKYLFRMKGDVANSELIN